MQGEHERRAKGNALREGPLHPMIAAECSGIDTGRTLTKDDAEAIDAGMDRYLP